MKRKILFSLISFVMILLVNGLCYAAVEIVPSKNGKGTDAIVNTTISNSYLLCRNMTNRGESLYGTTVVPHLATNKDWGAVSYLSNSFYGTNTAGKGNGIEVTIDGVKYYSTTTNITGVMNWGSNPNKIRRTQTSGLISDYDHSTSIVSEYVTELYKNKDTRFVDRKYGAGTATSAMYGQSVCVGQSNNDPVSIRCSLFSTYWGKGNGGYYPTGKSESDTTFRPVIWNK